jgi:hypothetical protein
MNGWCEGERNVLAKGSYGNTKFISTSASGHEPDDLRKQRRRSGIWGSAVVPNGSGWHVELPQAADAPARHWFAFQKGQYSEMPLLAALPHVSVRARPHSHRAC